MDGIASGKVKRADGTVGDSASAAALRAIQDDVAANRKLLQYAQPGTSAASTQARLTLDTNALTVAPAEQKPVDLKMKGVDQFSLYPDDHDKGGKACFEAAVKACTDYNTKQHGKEAPPLNGSQDTRRLRGDAGPDLQGHPLMHGARRGQHRVRSCRMRKKRANSSLVAKALDSSRVGPTDESTSTIC